MRDDSRLGIMPASSSGTAIGTTREYLACIDGKDEAKTISASTIRDTLADVRAVIRPGSMLHDQVWKRLRGDAVNKSVLTWDGAYHKDEEEETFPPMHHLALPMTGRRYNIWSDGHVAIVGRAATPAFQRYEEDMVDKASNKSSPYRKAGLSPREAKEAERRRLKEYETYPPPGFGGIFPTTQGDRLVYAGLYQGRPDGYRGRDVTECLLRGPDGRWLGVAAAKVKYVMDCIKSVYGVRIKLDDITWRRCSEESGYRGVMMHLESECDEDMLLEGVATVIDEWKRKSTEQSDVSSEEITDAEDAGAGEMEGVAALPQSMSGMCAMLMPLVAQLDLHVPDETFGLWSDEDYREDVVEVELVERNKEWEMQKKRGTVSEVEQMGLF